MASGVWRSGTASASATLTRCTTRPDRTWSRTAYSAGSVMPVRNRLLIAIALVSLNGVPARLSSQAQVSPSVSTLRAVVVSDDGLRTPLADAEVTLAGTLAVDGSRFERSVTTGEDGICLLEGVPNGRYTLRAGRAGYVTTFFGATAGDMEPTPIAIGERELPSRFEVRLPGGGAISGNVRNTRGLPAAGASVLLMQFVGGDRRFARMSDAATAGAVVRTVADSTGAYRLYGLAPGDYVIQATNVEHAGGEPLMTRGYFAGTADIVSASSVNVSSGQESMGVNFQLEPVTLVDVSGSIAGSLVQMQSRLRMLMFPQGLFWNPATETEARFVLASPDGLFSNPVTVAPDGTFVLRAVPPGLYELWVRSVPRNVAAEDDGGPAVWGHAAVSVGASNLSNVVVSLQDSIIVAGRVVLDAAGAQDKRIFAGGSVVLTPTEPPGVRS